MQTNHSISRTSRQSSQTLEKTQGTNTTITVPLAHPHIPKKLPSKFKRFVVDELPPCQMYRTRTSLDYIANPIDQPKLPKKYVPPYRRNFRYFGYPQNLNLDVNTPPRVKSWGSIEGISTKSPKKLHTPRNAPVAQDADFDPNWMGRLLKSNLLLENPGLIPPADKAAISSGNQDKLKFVHPEFEVHNCPSELFFPITPKSRKAFCKINKMVQDKLDKQMHAYSVQNPTIMKLANLEHEVLKAEAEKNSNLLNDPPTRRSTIGDTKKSNFTFNSFTEFNVPSTSEEDLESAKLMSPVIKTLCNEKNYPGMNRQLYERPKVLDDGRDDKTKGLDDSLIYGIARIPEFSLNMPEDVWLKLTSARNRQNQMQKNAELRKQIHDPDYGKFQTFTQVELRDQVLRNARENFMERLKEDFNAPLPPELFRDNRDEYEPHHDYFGKGEFPVQGPYYYKIRSEAPPSEEELNFVEKFVQEAKDHHDNTHHLPGLMHNPRHPFKAVELDWMEVGTEMEKIPESRKTPSNLHEMPAFMMSLGKERFEEKFKKAMREGAKELVGPAIWNLYKRTYGIQELPEVKESSKQVPAKMRVKKRRKRSVKPRRMSAQVPLVEEDEDEDEDEEEGEEEDQDEGVNKVDEDAEKELQPGLSTPSIEVEPEYTLSADLLEDHEFPLPNIHFDLIEFPEDNIPEGLKKDLKYFKKELERGEPVTVQEEEADGEGGSSSSTTDSEEGVVNDDGNKKFDHDPVSHLQVMYQDAIKMKHKSSHLPIQKMHEMEPPKLKDILLEDSYAENIDYLLHKADPLPKYLQVI